jgi:hypothetical protein
MLDPDVPAGLPILWSGAGWRSLNLAHRVINEKVSLIGLRLQT